MMSESELSDAPSGSIPPDATLAKELRKQVATWLKKSGSEEITVNKIRDVTEKALGLNVGFFNGHPTWKTKSKTIIKDAVENPEAPPSSSPAKSSSVKKATTKIPPKSGRAKRPSPAPEGPTKKRQKKSLPKAECEDDLSSPPTDLSSDEDKPKPKKPSKPKPPAASKLPKKEPESKPMRISKPRPKKAASPSELSDVPAEESEEESNIATKPKPDDESGSELSELLDEEPKPKKRRKSKDISTKSQKPSKPPADTDPDQEEIKRLQGWLVKCGIRKLWGKELKPYETSRGKIKHLKDMLSDVGMTGRYSQEKASQIREARELAADIEAVQEGAERWGKDADQDGEDEDDDGRSKRRLVKGVKHYDFLSSDGEETD